MSDPIKAARPTRFARLYSDGGLGVEAAGVPYEEARRRLTGSSDDDDVELLEIEITVVRNHGQPKIQLVRGTVVQCMTCGETMHVEIPSGAAAVRAAGGAE